MRLVIQRVKHAQVDIDGKTVGKIDQGFMVLIGIAQTDTKEIADKYIKKMLGLRIFEDENGKTNRSLKDVDGSLLLISQFTLYADCRHGNRPGFTDAGKPDVALPLYQFFTEKCAEEGYHVETGEFGADMKVSLLNDGPFTIVLDEHLFER